MKNVALKTKDVTRRKEEHMKKNKDKELKCKNENLRRKDLDLNQIHKVVHMKPDTVEIVKEVETGKVKSFILYLK